jgi:hypothetical protein
MLDCAYLSGTTVTDQDELESGSLSHFGMRRLKKPKKG